MDHSNYDFESPMVCIHHRMSLIAEQIDSFVVQSKKKEDFRIYLRKFD